MRILLKDCKIQDTITDFQGVKDIFIQDGIIERIENNIEAIVDRVIALEGLLVVPAFVDLHCHLREPGYEYKETIKTGASAAAKGGYTTICCMPNTNPVIDNVSTLKELYEIIEKDASINVIPIGAVTIGQQGKQMVDFQNMIDNGVRLFSDDGFPIWDNSIMKNALELSKQKGFLIIDHCEDLGLVNGGVIHQGDTAKLFGLKGISGLSEELMIIRDLALAEETKANVHIAHISTKKSLDIIKEAKSRFINVSCEVTPHHISLSEEDIELDNTDYKVNPPLRTKADVKALQNGLRDNTIDIIATDHAPHALEDKPKDFYKADNGISGIEIAFSICYTYLVKNGILSLKELLNKMSLNPSKILGIEQGRIKEGGLANLAILDLDKKFLVDKDKFLSMGKNTPYHGRELFGEVVMTIADGKLVFEKKGVF